MYKILPKAGLPELIREWQEQAAVTAPVRHGDLSQFRELNGAAELDLCLAANPRYPPKSLFLPQSETMFHVRGIEFESVDEEVSPRVILGVRACDARAIQLLDGVFGSDGNPDPYWVRRRKETTLVGLGCAKPGATCFCTAVGSGPFDRRGTDAMLVEVDDVYVADVRNAKGEMLFGHLPDASQGQIDASHRVQVAAASRVKVPFEAEGIKDKLYSLLNSGFWFEIQQSCLGCGVCTFLCPTCHCFDIVDEVQRSSRVRNWDSCMFRIYSQQASGHNPRPTNVERTRQRIMHKYAFFVENHDEIGCTGCGRCVRYCPVGLDIRQIIHSAQLREEQ